MFCPKCNQQQASDEMRFCSRCGFPLSVVADLVAHNGVLTMIGEEMREDRLSPRQKGVRQGVLLLFASLIVGFVTALLSVFVLGKPELFIPVTAGLFFLSGILRILYAYMFEPGPHPGAHIAEQTVATAQIRTSERGQALPPAATMATAGYVARGVNTAEMVTPPSVTEQTTRLLDRDSLAAREE